MPQGGHMNHRRVLWLTVFAVVIASASLMEVSLAGQTASGGTASPAYTPPKTPWGDPDLQGVYDFSTWVNLERPVEFSGRTTRTEAEMAALAKAHKGQTEGWSPRHFVDDTRTALVTDPPDGKIPLTPEGGKRYM